MSSRTDPYVIQKDVNGQWKPAFPCIKGHVQADTASAAALAFHLRVSRCRMPYRLIQYSGMGADRLNVLALHGVEIGSDDADSVGSNIEVELSAGRRLMGLPSGAVPA